VVVGAVVLGAVVVVRVGAVDGVVVAVGRVVAQVVVGAGLTVVTVVTVVGGGGASDGVGLGTLGDGDCEFC
jgi:hypothetical protein